jgi:hypothetical protein
MNTKTSWVLLGLVLLGVVFVPLIPNDTPIECNSVANEETGQSCDEGAGYVSLYTKYFSR